MTEYPLIEEPDTCGIGAYDGRRIAGLCCLPGGFGGVAEGPRR